MAKRPAPGKPHVGQRVWLGGEITMIIPAIHGPERVTIKLDKFEQPVTIIWSEPDDHSLVVCSEE